MKGKKAIRYLLLFFAIDLLICSAYLAGYVRGMGYEQPTIPMACAHLTLTFLMGVLVMLFGVLTEKDENHIKIRKAALWIGGFFVFGSVAAMLIVVFFS